MIQRFGRPKCVHVVRRVSGLYLGKEFPDAYPFSFAPGNVWPGVGRPHGGGCGARSVTTRELTRRPVGSLRPRPPHTHKGLFGRRHCVECQRAYVKAHDGVDVPAPPSIAPA